MRILTLLPIWPGITPSRKNGGDLNIGNVELAKLTRPLTRTDAGLYRV